MLKRLCLIPLLVIFTCASHSFLTSAEINERVLICGVCRNIAPAVPNTIENIKKLGEKFTDYQVIIYENNSDDATKSLLSAWAKKSSKVAFLTETLSSSELPRSREERISRARNIVLEHARALDYKKYKYLIMADLDFTGPWPIQEIVKSLKSKKEWDCISANGLNHVYVNGIMKTVYWDRYAYRSQQYPLGPEVLGGRWWKDLANEWFRVKQPTWISVYSAFGGLAIYKTKTILTFSYSGVVTDDLERYYQKIICSVNQSNPQLQRYYELAQSGAPHERGIFSFGSPPSIPISRIICCEHGPLHASMALHGFGKFYVNPKMKMYYFDR